MLARYFIQPLAILTALMLISPAALSQVDVGSLKSAVEGAWQRSPQARTLEARRSEILAGQQAAQSWMAGSPSLGLSEHSDRWTDQNGVRETDVSLSIPIRLPAQKSALQTLARTSAGDLEAQIIHARLSIAGEVREHLWAVAAAQAVLSETQDHQHHLEGLTAEIGRRVKAGELARTDGMLARQEVLAAEGAVANAQAKLYEVRTRYKVLTGQPDIPVPVPEPLAAEQTAPHPRLHSARGTLNRTQAAHSVVRATRNDPPTIGIAMRRERDGASGGSSRSVGLAVQIPFGNSVRNRPVEAAALTQIQTAAAEMAQAEATVQGDAELARQQLAVSEKAQGVATARAAVMREHTQLIGKAFRLGERGLADLLRSEALSHEAEIAVRQQQVAVGLAHARLNQALGVLP